MLAVINNMCTEVWMHYPSKKFLSRSWQNSYLVKILTRLPDFAPKILHDLQELPNMILPNLVRNFARFIGYISCQFVPHLPCLILPNFTRNLARLCMV